jgi:hypothetical protein
MNEHSTDEPRISEEQAEQVQRALLRADEGIQPPNGWDAATARLWQRIEAVDDRRIRSRSRLRLGWAAGLAAAALLLIGLGLQVYTLRNENARLRTAMTRQAEEAAKVASMAVLPLHEATEFLRVWNEVRTFFDDAPAWVARTDGGVRMGLSPVAAEAETQGRPIVVRVFLVSVEADRHISADLAMLTGHACAVRLGRPDVGTVELQVSDAHINGDAALRVAVLARGVEDAAADVAAQLAGAARLRPGRPAELGVIRLSDGLYRVEVSALWDFSGNQPPDYASS